jgi:hypothetical protein
MTPKEMSAHNKAIAAQIKTLKEQGAKYYSEVIPPVQVGETVNYNHGKSTQAVIKKVTPYVSGESMMFIGFLCPIKKDGTEGISVAYRSSDYVGFVKEKLNQ